MADNKLLELIGVLNEQSKKNRVTDADKKELDRIIGCLEGSEIPDYRIAANIADVSEFAIHVNNKVNTGCYYYESAAKQDEQLKEAYYFQCKQFMGEAIKDSQWLIQNAEVNISSVSNNHKYLLKKIIEKAIENIAKSKEYVMGIQIGNEHENAIDKIVSNLEAAETTLKGKVEELNKQFTDKRSQKEKISESATQVYNSYLLLYKLNELKVDGGKSLQEVISEAIDSGKQEVSITVNKENYKVEITPEGKLEIKVLNQYTKPAIPEVKDVLEYTNKDIINLWANSEVSIEKDESIKKDQNNNWAFAVGLHDKSRSLDLKVGGLGKKVPFSLRFANFYKVIEILKDESKPLKERFRLANNIATGSGKTGDIALLKFWAYLADIPCITMVPSDTLRNQSNKFDEEFLPSEVAMEFGEPFSEGNTRYATTTFTEVLDKQWNLFNNTYGKDNGESALIMIDEAPKLKENAVLLARAIAIARNNSIAFFSATPDKFLNALFEIILQILLSPKERTKLGTGKLPEVFYKEIKPLTLLNKSREVSWNHISLQEEYILQNEITHRIIGNLPQQSSEDLSSRQLLDVVSRLIDSSINKKGLIITDVSSSQETVKSFVDSTKISGNDPSYIAHQKRTLEKRNKDRKESYIKVIKELYPQLSDETINAHIEIPANYSESLKFIPLHGLIDIAKGFLTQYGDNLSTALDNVNLSDSELKDNISKFIKTRYNIDNGDYFQPKDRLINVIFNIIQHIKRKSANTEYIHSIDRNYTADKKLNADIMQIDGVQEFCDYYRMISCFADPYGKIQHIKREVKHGTTEVASTDIQNSERNIEILLNMFKAKLIGNFVADKKMGIGVDDLDLDKVVCFTEGPTDLLDPAYELQVLGRGGRGKQKGTYFFYRYTGSVGYFKHSDIALLNGEDLRKNFEKAREDYIKAEQANIERRSISILNNVGHICHKLPGSEEYLKEVGKILKDEFNDLNIQCDYDKKIAIDTFIKVLKKITSAKKDLYGSFKNTYQEKAWFLIERWFGIYGINDNKKQNEISDKIVGVIDNAIKGLESTTENPNSYWSRVAHAPIMTWEQIANGDPNSTFPIFMEQKQISQNQDASAHNVGQSVILPSTDTQQHQDASAHNVGQSVILPSTDTQQHQDASAHNIGQSPATQSNPSQCTEKELMYGFMLALLPWAAVVIYALVVDVKAFNPDVAIGIFIGVLVISFALFATVKKVCDKQSGSGMDTPPTTSGTNLSSLNLSEGMTHGI